MPIFRKPKDYVQKVSRNTVINAKRNGFRVMWLVSDESGE